MDASSCSKASALPESASKSFTRSSIRAVISSERCTPMTETFRHREVTSERKASIWKVKDFFISSRGLLSCPSRSRTAKSENSSSAASAPI